MRIRKRLGDILNQTIVETKVYFRHRVLFFWSFGFPLLFLLVFSPEQKSLEFSFSGIVVMSLLTTCFINTVSMIVSERRQKLYKRLKVTPLGQGTLIAAKFVNRYLILVIQMVLLFAVAAVVFNIQPRGSLLDLAIILSLSALCFLSTATFVAGIVMDEYAANIVAMIVFFVLSFGSNTFFSISLYPAEIQPIIWALPTTHLATALREIMAGPSNPATMQTALAWLSGYWLVFTLLSIRFFRWEV
jgi:ABC-2 type transport system permease protein